MKIFYITSELVTTEDILVTNETRQLSGMFLDTRYVKDIPIGT